MILEIKLDPIYGGHVAAGAPAREHDREDVPRQREELDKLGGRRRAAPLDEKVKQAQIYAPLMYVFLPAAGNSDGRQEIGGLVRHRIVLGVTFACMVLGSVSPPLTNAWTYTAGHGYFLLVLYFLFNVYVVLDAIPQTNVPGPSGI